jgi:hypothetical protein
MDLVLGSDWLEDALPLREGDAVVASAEGGDRVVRLLAARPRRVAVVDRVPAQLCLVELKLAALKALAYPEYQELLGLRPSRRRRALYQRLRWLLRKEADEFWLARLGVLDRGVAFQGAFERRLACFRQFVRFVHGRRKVERFLTLPSEAERRSFYAGEWQTFLWKKFGAALWKRWFDVPAGRLERLLLDGRLLAPPFAIAVETFEAAKEMANRALVVWEPPEAHFRSLPGRSIDAFALGRMELSGLGPEIARLAAPGARIVYVADGQAPGGLSGFIPVGPPREAGFFPGYLVAGSFVA